MRTTGDKARDGEEEGEREEGAEVGAPAINIGWDVRRRGGMAQPLIGSGVCGGQAGRQAVGGAIKQSRDLRNERTSRVCG